MFDFDEDEVHDAEARPSNWTGDDAECQTEDLGIRSRRLVISLLLCVVLLLEVRLRQQLGHPIWFEGWRSRMTTIASQGKR
eukprot:6485746-Amphidinium_carterae.2